MNCALLLKKGQLIWVVIANYCESKQMVRLSVGSKTYKTLNRVLISLQWPECKIIYTDELKHYRFLIQKKSYCTKSRMTNHEQRLHLNLCTHLKRLNRRSICFSRSVVILNCILKIYLWGSSRFFFGRPGEHHRTDRQQRHSLLYLPPHRAVDDRRLWRALSYRKLRRLGTEKSCLILRLESFLISMMTTGSWWRK